MPFWEVRFFGLCDCCREGSFGDIQRQVYQRVHLDAKLSRKKGSFRTKALDGVTDVESALFL